MRSLYTASLLALACAVAHSAVYAQEDGCTPPAPADKAQANSPEESPTPAKSAVAEKAPTAGQPAELPAPPAAKKTPSPPKATKPSTRSSGLTTEQKAEIGGEVDRRFNSPEVEAKIGRSVKEYFDSPKFKEQLDAKVSEAVKRMAADYARQVEEDMEETPATQAKAAPPVTTQTANVPAATQTAAVTQQAAVAPTQPQASPAVKQEGAITKVAQAPAATQQQAATNARSGGCHPWPDGTNRVEPYGPHFAHFLLNGGGNGNTCNGKTCNVCRNCGQVHQ